MTAENKIESEYEKLNTNNQWAIAYDRIRTESSKTKESTAEANRTQNKILNRYRDVSPYDHSRVILQRGDIDYINANIVPVEKADRKYILTQGPLPNTVSHFWLMIWEQDSRAVLMLNKLVEKKQEKCFRYWPVKMGTDNGLVMTSVGLRLEYVSQQDYSHYLVRTLRLCDIKSDQKRDILQFHYTTWPDFGVPACPNAFLNFLLRVRHAGVLNANVGPAVVHCSAGIGRSGTFCLVDSCLVLVEKFGVSTVDVNEILLEMRKYRMGLIQTPEQLRFSYEAIIEGIKLLSNPSSITLDENGVEVCGGSAESGGEEEDPPPLPPPRMDSLKKVNGIPSLDRPLPTIPNSVSLNDFNNYKDDSDDSDTNKVFIPSGPLPTVPADDEDEEDIIENDDGDEELIEESSSCSDSEISDSSKNDETISSLEKNDMMAKDAESLSPYELRQRKRVEQKEKLTTQLKEMKRRQKANEHWTQLKRPKRSSALQD